jgi:hypothetical protein
MRKIAVLLLIVLGTISVTIGQVSRATPALPSGVPTGAIYSETFHGTDGNYYDIWVFNGQEYWSCQSCKTETVTNTVTEYKDRIQYVDREVVKEVPIYIQAEKESQQVNIADILAIMEAQDNKKRADYLLMEQLKIQRRQGRAQITIGALLGTANAAGSILNGIGSYRYGTAAMNGMLRNIYNSTTNNSTTTNPGGPWTGGNTPPNNGSNNNGGNVYADNDPLWNTAGSSGSGLSSGTTNTIFTGTNGGGGGGPFTGGTTNTRRTNATDLLNGW